MVESDFLGRIKALTETAGGLGIIALGILLLILLTLAVTNKRSALLAAFMVAAPFSGAIYASFDSGSTLLRWAAMFFISITVIYGIRWPGWPTIFLGITSVILIIMSFTGPYVSYTAQRSVLFFILTVPMALAVAHYFKGMTEIVRFLKLFLFAGGIYALMAIACLPSLRGGARFSGVTAGAPLFVITGGMLLPFAVWGAMQAGSRSLRIYCIVITVCISLTNVLSAQRTGTFAGFIGCLPLLTRFGFRKILTSMLVIILCVGALLVGLALFPSQAEFVHTRFLEGDTTGRTNLWRSALEACLDKPLYGHGMGSSVEVFGGGFHNAFLAAWYEGGIFCFLFFTAAYLGTVLKSLRLILKGSTKEIKDMGRLLLGILLACISAGFFEESFYSPSNISGFIGLTTCIITYRLSIIDREAAREARESLEWQFSPPEDVDAGEARVGVYT